MKWKKEIHQQVSMTCWWCRRSDGAHPQVLMTRGWLASHVGGSWNTPTSHFDLLVVFEMRWSPLTSHCDLWVVWGLASCAWGVETYQRVIMTCWWCWWCRRWDDTHPQVSTTHGWFGGCHRVWEGVETHQQVILTRWWCWRLCSYQKMSISIVKYKRNRKKLTKWPKQRDTSFGPVIVDNSIGLLTSSRVSNHKTRNK